MARPLYRRLVCGAIRSSVWVVAAGVAASSVDRDPGCCLCLECETIVEAVVTGPGEKGCRLSGTDDCGIPGSMLLLFTL